MTTDSSNTTAYTEFQEMLTTVGGITLGGDETLEELAEMCEAMLGDLV